MWRSGYITVQPSAILGGGGNPHSWALEEVSSHDPSLVVAHVPPHGLAVLLLVEGPPTHEPLEPPVRRFRGLYLEDVLDFAR